jgi:hypothetical protein
VKRNPVIFSRIQVAVVVSFTSSFRLSLQAWRPGWRPSKGSSWQLAIRSIGACAALPRRRPEASLSFPFWGAGLFVLPMIAIYTIAVYWLFRQDAEGVRRSTSCGARIGWLSKPSHGPCIRQRTNKEKAMLRIKSTLLFLAACAVVSACANQVQNKEDMLAAAGFTLVPANTPQRQASLSALPPHKFVHQVRHNVVIFTYADPTICDCLYVGNQAAYDRYRQDVFAKNIANEQQMTAQINEMDWGPWGPGWYY